MPRASRRWILACVATTGCNLIVGVDDFQPEAAGGGGGTGVTVASTGGGNAGGAAGTGGGGGPLCGNGAVDPGEACDVATLTNGTCVACAVVCDTDFGDCNTDGLDGCEADLAADGDNCGTCGHDCLGAACAAGLCTPETLATAEPGARAVFVTGDAVYWANNVTGEIRRRAKSDGVVTTPASGVGHPMDLVVDATHVYFTSYDDGTLERVPITGGVAEILHDEPSPLQGRWLVQDATDVYWVSWSSTAGNGKLHRLAKAGGSVTTKAAPSVFSYQTLAVDQTHVYFGTTNWIVYRVPKTLAAADAYQTLLASTGNGQPRGMVTDAMNVYWSTDQGAVQKEATFGGSPTTLVSGLANAPDVALRDGTLFVLASGTVAAPDGKLVSLPNAGGTPTTIANISITAINVDVDDTHVYWSDPGVGEIYRVAR